ncbi:MAG: hypothetical protein MJB14_18400, partial [Spirochaetes bacterium]|nr:hypothetical protein [Spirochaetota bacterium]
MSNDKLNALSQSDTSTHLYLLTQAEKNNELLLIYPENHPLNTNQLVVHFDNSQIDNIENKIKHLLKTYFKFQIIPTQSQYFWQKVIIDFLAGSGIFVFMAIIIVDPIPLVDEILLSLCGAFLVHHFFSNSVIAPFISEKKINNCIKKYPIEFHFSTKKKKINHLYQHFHQKNEK